MSYKVNTSQFRNNMKKQQKQIQEDCYNIVKKGGISYANTAVKYVPPKNNGSWSKSIQQKYYKRGIQYLPDEIKKDTRNRRQYNAKLRQGYLFVVKGRLKGKPHKWYATTLRNATKFTRIFNRGLFKIMFGINLGVLGQMPSIFSKLLAKSPNLNKHSNLNKITTQQGETAKVKIVNDAWDNDKYARQAIYQGDKSAKRAMNKLIKQMNNKKVKV